jgi:hypothetical protein
MMLARKQEVLQTPIVTASIINRAWDGLELKQIFRGKKPVTKFMS